MKILIVSGTFDHNGGMKSSVASKIIAGFTNYKHPEDLILDSYNGGCLEDIQQIDFTEYDIAFWAPNISNDESKIIPNIKKINSKLFLISSKRVVEKHYQESDIIGRLLASKSNLGVMITKPDAQYNFKVLDPLGNCYADTSDITDMCTKLLDRVYFVKGLNRVQCKNIGDKRNFDINPSFLEFVRQSAHEFTKHVNAVNPNRLLGNASTRCMFGFPAQKDDERIFVTRRNIDKELINHNGFVEVNPACEDVVEYYGDKKPSVDTPIQIRLFNYYHNINYMVHGHVYIEGAPITDDKIPCGYIEEFDSIVDLFPSREERFFAINLRGHGCLLFSEDVETLWELGEYVSREFPEG